MDGVRREWNGVKVCEVRNSGKEEKEILLSPPYSSVWLDQLKYTPLQIPQNPSLLSF